MQSETATKLRQNRVSQRPPSDISMKLIYTKEVYIAGKMRSEFWFRGDDQCKHFGCKSQLLALMYTLVRETSRCEVLEYGIYDNRAAAPDYPKNIIINRINGVYIHDNTGLYPDQVFELINKYVEKIHKK